jgi:NADH-quinone oxidoreductase subunit F
VKYLICNGDEGDPGAFMDRMLLESFPYRVLEGVLIAARAVDAGRAILYVREEYDRAVRVLRAALERMAEGGILKLLPRPDFRVDVFTGAGAFVCGEETALIASLGGRRGASVRRPPYPAERGLEGRPTLVNNVETFACVPWIFTHGAERFAFIGAGNSRGTKAFALAGKIRRGGLIEVPMGMTLREILHDIGGGPEPGRRLKAVQIGGPSGGCLPERMFDRPVDFDALAASGAIMGSGGLVALDDQDCMVDIALYFMRFTAEESCGKCACCRVGAQQMIFILSRLAEGKAGRDDIVRLRELGQVMKAGSLCNLGRTAPNPALTALEHFADEFAAHAEGRCPAGKCRALARFAANDNCVGCTLCAQHCPADAIPFSPYERPAIDVSLCARCAACRSVCPADAMEAVYD